MAAFLKVESELNYKVNIIGKGVYDSALIIRLELQPYEIYIQSV